MLGSRTVGNGRSVTASCSARAALAGNPSDGYGGAVVAVPVPDLRATAAATHAERFSVDDRDPELHRLLQATADAFVEHVGRLPPVHLSASTSIPRSVGLAGSSALVIATLRALGGAVEYRWDRLELAQLALAVERDRMGITAGLQDRLVQSVDEPLAMEFDPIGYEILHLGSDATLFVAWDPAAAETSDTVHRALKRRHRADDPLVRTGMAALADEARRAAAAIAANDLGELGRAMNATFDLRRSMIDVSPLQVELVEVGRRAGAAVNSAGSGGSVVGLAKDEDHLARLQTAYEAAGSEFVDVVL